ncbi:hypothetical protein [Spirillospora sp. NPDC047279]|uniref:hypothetical protein n=1 Tax=Spirillospora sp. NPDC047279 TaxID=3155478 RepID=UPI0033DBBF70
MRRRTFATMSLIPALALTLTLSACGGGGSGSGASPTAKKTDELTAMRAFAKCMRANGVNMSDPEPQGDGGMLTKVEGGAKKGESPKKMEAAQAKCRHLMPNGGKPPKLSPEQVAKMRAFAKCMRENGIDMPDPSDDGLIQHKVENKPGAPGAKKESIGQDPDSPKFKAAHKACGHLEPARPGQEKGN